MIAFCNTIFIFSIYISTKKQDENNYQNKIILRTLPNFKNKIIYSRPHIRVNRSMSKTKNNLTQAVCEAGNNFNTKTSTGVHLVFSLSQLKSIPESTMK